MLRMIVFVAFLCAIVMHFVKGGHFCFYHPFCHQHIWRKIWQKIFEGNFLYFGFKRLEIIL